MQKQKRNNMSDLDWPVGFERTNPSERTRNNNYDVTLARSFDDLEAELKRLGVDDYRYEFDARQRKRDNRPYARANPDDPSFVLKWTMDGEQYAVACDRYSRLRDNVRTVGHYLREKRKMEGRPVATGESEFANARLPPADEDAVVASGTVPPHIVLGVDKDASDNEVQQAFREKAKTAHADTGGCNEEMKDLLDAREAMLDG